MLKKIVVLLVVLSMAGFMFTSCSKGGGNYPELTSVIEQAITIAKDNKDNAEEGKKQIEALEAGLDRGKLQTEMEAFGIAIAPKMEKLQAELEGMDGMEAFGKMIQKMMDIMGEELPAMKKLMELQMGDPAAAAILNDFDIVGEMMFGGM